MVQAAPVGLPSKKDYVNFSADSALMQLIGGGKSLSLLQYRWFSKLVLTLFI